MKGVCASGLGARQLPPWMCSFSCPTPCGHTDILILRSAENLKSLLRLTNERQKGIVRPRLSHIGVPITSTTAAVVVSHPVVLPPTSRKKQVAAQGSQGRWRNMTNTIYFTSLRYHDTAEQGSEIATASDNENSGEESSGADNLVACTENIYNGLLEKVSTRPVIRIKCFGSPSDDEKEDVQKSDKLHVLSTVTVNSPAPKWLSAVAADVTEGWPVWLSAVADVTEGWDPLQARNFEKLEKIGYGPRSIVYKGRNVLTGKFVAMKKVRFDNLDPVSVKCMAKEILILRELDHPNVIKLEGLITSKTSSTLYLVFDYMKHDLASLSATPGICRFSEDQVKSYMNQLLSGLDYCHRRGVLHCNIDGSHLLIHNNRRMLKIAGFGSASILSFDSKSLPSCNLVYKAPEIVYGENYGIGVDLWSAGCILAAFLGGKPIMAAQIEAKQWLMIYKSYGIISEEGWRRNFSPYKNSVKETFKEFPPSTLALLETLLATDPAERETASAALMSEFFTTEPLGCQDSSFQKSPPKEELVNLKKKKVRSHSEFNSVFLSTAGIPVRRSRSGVQYIDGS